MRFLLVLGIYLVSVGLIHLKVNEEVTPTCSKNDIKCSVTWTLEKEETMMLYGPNATGEPVFYLDGRFVRRESTGLLSNDCSPVQNLTQSEMDQINFGTGLHKFVYTINKQIPGPTLVFYKDQMVEITVINKIPHEGASLHWHGTVQQGTPHMDGVPMVSQCPIHPGETFVYRFKAESLGTRWYHSHVGVQRGDGLYGGFVVLDEEGDRQRNWVFEKDFFMMVQDWVQEEAVRDLYASTFSTTKFLEDGYDQPGPTCEFAPVSILINGRGYMYKHDTEEPVVPVPLTTYIVKANKKYRFRITNSGIDKPLKVHIDQHELNVIATDGSPLKEFKVDYVAMHTGERYDIYIETNQTPGLYWIRVDEVESERQSGLAILKYEEYNGPEEFPTSNRTECTSSNKCIVSNCPFQKYLPKYDHLNLECKNIEQMEAYEDTAHNEEELDIEEHFLMFQFTYNERNSDQPSANARHYIEPSKPPQVLNTVDIDVPCDKAKCDAGPCECTFILPVSKNKTIQMVWASGDGFFGHPIHLHGHDFEVLKMEYQDFRNDPDPRPQGVHPDLICNTASTNVYPRCTNPTWKNSSWTGSNVPGINLVNPPMKDTISIPRGAYAVIRFKSNNPGFWMLHCHVDFHFAHGMGLLMQEGTTNDMPDTPYGFATCGSFRNTGDPRTASTPQPPPAPPATEEVITTTTEKSARDRAAEVMIYVGCALGGFFVGALMFYVIFKCREIKREEKEKNSNVQVQMQEPTRF